MLAEVDPREVGGDHQGGNEMMVLSGELTTIEARIGDLEVELVAGDVPSLARVLRTLGGT